MSGASASGLAASGAAGGLDAAVRGLLDELAEPRACAAGTTRLPAARRATRAGAIRNVATGPPTRPPQTIPAIAAATAIDGAPTTPACSNAGANARPVAGPPVSVTEPTSTPNSGIEPERHREQQADHVLQHREHGRDHEET